LLFVDHSVRRMRWTPESVNTGSDISPTFKLNAASSNGFCIAPRPKGPKSPPLFAEEQSEYFAAISPILLVVDDLNFPSILHSFNEVKNCTKCEQQNGKSNNSTNCNSNTAFLRSG